MSKRTRSRKRRAQRASPAAKRKARRPRSVAGGAAQDAELAEFLAVVSDPTVRPEFRDALRNRLWRLVQELRASDERTGG